MSDFEFHPRYTKAQNTASASTAFIDRDIASRHEPQHLDPSIFHIESHILTTIISASYARTTSVWAGSRSNNKNITSRPYSIHFHSRALRFGNSGNERPVGVCFCARHPKRASNIEYAHCWSLSSSSHGFIHILTTRHYLPHSYTYLSEYRSARCARSFRCE